MKTEDTIEVPETPKVVLDYKNNAINAVISAVIGVAVTSVAAYFTHKVENRAKRNTIIVDNTEEK